MNNLLSPYDKVAVPPASTQLSMEQQKAIVAAHGGTEYLGTIKVPTCEVAFDILNEIGPRARLFTNGHYFKIKDAHAEVYLRRNWTSEFLRKDPPLDQPALVLARIEIPARYQNRGRFRALRTRMITWSLENQHTLFIESVGDASKWTSLERAGFRRLTAFGYHNSFVYLDSLPEIDRTWLLSLPSKEIDLKALVLEID